MSAPAWRACGLLVLLASTACDSGVPRKPAHDDTPRLASARDATPRSDGYCPGAERWPTGIRTCATDQECSAGERCWPDDVPWKRQEGSCAPRGVSPRRECETDRDCEGGVCVRATGEDACDRETMCVGRCTATSCAADERCGRDGRCWPKSCRAGYRCPADMVCDSTLADGHGCSPRQCTAGYACPPTMRCASGTGADEHGCAVIPCWDGGTCKSNETCERTDDPGDRGCRPRTCKTSSDCACGECVVGVCALRPGVCGEADAPPLPP